MCDLIAAAQQSASGPVGKGVLRSGASDRAATQRSMARADRDVAVHLFMSLKSKFPCLPEVARVAKINSAHLYLFPLINASTLGQINIFNRPRVRVQGRFSHGSKQNTCIDHRGQQMGPVQQRNWCICLRRSLTQRGLDSLRHTTLKIAGNLPAINSIQN